MTDAQLIFPESEKQRIKELKEKRRDEVMSLSGAVSLCCEGSVEPL